MFRGCGALRSPGKGGMEAIESYGPPMTLKHVRLHSRPIRPLRSATLLPPRSIRSARFESNPPRSPRPLCCAGGDAMDDDDVPEDLYQGADDELRPQKPDDVSGTVRAWQRLLARVCRVWGR
jgi:hypothetical protein